MTLHALVAIERSLLRLRHLSVRVVARGTGHLATALREARAPAHAVGVAVDLAACAALRLRAMVEVPDEVGEVLVGTVRVHGAVEG